MEFQTRTINGNIYSHKTLEDAIYHAKAVGVDGVCKISFIIPETNERVHLNKTVWGWVLDNPLTEFRK